MNKTEENLQFPIPNAVLEPYIKQAVSSAIISALGDGAKVIEVAVTAALNKKVDYQGNVARYDSDNKYLLIETLAIDSIKAIAKETITEMAESMRPAIKAQIVKELKTKHTELANVLVDGLISSLATKWSISINLSGDKR